MSTTFLTPALRARLAFAGPDSNPDLHAIDAYLKEQPGMEGIELNWQGTNGNMMIYSLLGNGMYMEAAIQMSHNDDGQVIRVMAEYIWNTMEKEETKDTFHSEGAGWFWVEELLQFAADAIDEKRKEDAK